VVTNPPPANSHNVLALGIKPKNWDIGTFDRRL
jgi:hypothetical protein